MPKSPLIPPGPHRGPPPIDKERLEQLRKRAAPLGPHTGVVTDFEKGCLLVIGRGPLDIYDTVVALPLSLLLASAAQIMAQVAVPMLAQAENAPKMPDPAKVD